MPSVGARCHELRIQDENQTWRVLYRLDADVILILDVFMKKAQQTPKSVINAAQRRLRRMTRLQEGSVDKAKQSRVKKAGWKIGSAEEFLGLSDGEVQFVELKLALSDELKERRADLGLSQTQLAERLGSSQSRVAKMEAGDPGVSVDLLIRSLLATGASKAVIAGAIRRKGARKGLAKTARSNVR